MLISDDHKLMFFHIRKTAGTSITRALEKDMERLHPLALPEGYPHETVQEFVDRHGVAVYRRYRSFAFTRHPLDRFLSQYKFMQGRREKIPFMQTVSSVRQFIEAIRDNERVRVNLGNGQHKIEGMATLARPQHEYVRLGSNPRAVTHLPKQEDISRIWPGFCVQLGLPVRYLPTLNKSAPIPVDDLDYVAIFVEDYYRDDYELFGYRRKALSLRARVAALFSRSSEARR